MLESVEDLSFYDAIMMMITMAVMAMTTMTVMLGLDRLNQSKIFQVFLPTNPPNAAFHTSLKDDIVK